jgi:hypothetical protein
MNKDLFGIYEDFLDNGTDAFQEIANVTVRNTEIAMTLLKNTLGRKGLMQEFDGFADDVRNQILEDWIAIVSTSATPKGMVVRIMSDMSQRQGWDAIWDTIDSETKEEIADTWEKKIFEILKRDAPVEVINIRVVNLSDLFVYSDDLEAFQNEANNKWTWGVNQRRT